LLARNARQCLLPFGSSLFTFTCTWASNRAGYQQTCHVNVNVYIDANVDSPVVSASATGVEISTPPPLHIEPRVPDRPRPKLAASTRQPIGAVLDFLHNGVEIVAGSAEMADAFIGFADWCKARSSRPLSVAKFVEEIERLRNQFTLSIVVEGDDRYLIDVQLAPVRVTV
jgi:hypothetical protein